LLNGCERCLFASLVLLACSGTRPRYADPSAHFSASGELSEQWLEDRPPLVVIDRAGDGATAIAFAAQTGEPPVANYALSLLVQRRLARAGVPSEANANGFGFSIGVLVSEPSKADPAMSALWHALHRGIDSSDVDRSLLDDVARRFVTGEVDTPAELAIARCAGQLFLDGRQTAALANVPTLVRWLESARQQAFSRNHGRFAIVGSALVAGSVKSRLLQLPAWPNHEKEEPDEPTVTLAPAVHVTNSHEWRLSLAWKLGSFGTASHAWRSLRAQDSPLLTQLAGLESGWRVDALSAIAAPVGGCLKIDISAPDTTSLKSAADVARVARLLVNESRIALADMAAKNAPDDPQLVTSDPRITARRAAWRLLSVDRPNGRPSLHMSVRAPRDRAGDAEKFAERSTLEPSVALELRHKVERAQPEQWVLLASTCGAFAESSQDSGASAAWLRTLARKHAGTQGIVIEPWLSEDGVGLLAHGKPQSAVETEESLLRRLSDALGRGVATSRVTGQDLAYTREELLVRVGVQPRRARGLLLDTVSAQRPSMFEPSGTQESIRYLSISDLLVSRRRWIREPLRAAVLTRDTSSRPDVVRTALARWLDPHRTSDLRCESTEVGYPSAEETHVITSSPDELDANAYVAYHLHSSKGFVRSYERWLEWLLNRRGGWLERFVIEPGLARAAAAYIKGPRGRRVLFIELSTGLEAAVPVAVDRVREFLAETVRMGPVPAEIELARRWSEEASIRSELDPRNRLVQLWLGESARSRPSSAGFAPFLAAALGSAPVTIVKVRK